MTSNLLIYRKQAGFRLSELLGADWRFYRSKMEFKKSDGLGECVISLHDKSKFSPHIGFEIHFHRAYKVSDEILCFVRRDQWQVVSQNSFNRLKMNGLPSIGDGATEWQVNITEPLPEAVLHSMHDFIVLTALPFFERFQHLKAARDALAQGDDWCVMGGAGPSAFYVYKSVLAMDMALNNPAHFQSWLAQCAERGLDASTVHHAQGLLDQWQSDPNRFVQQP